MLEAEPLTGADRRRSILRRHDNGHLRQPAQGMRPYPGRLSRFDARWVKVLVVIFREIVEAAFKQCDDPVGGMRRYFFPPRDLMLTTTRFCNPLRRCLALDHSQLNFLPVLKANFGERFKNPVFVESFDGLCHG